MATSNNTTFDLRAAWDRAASTIGGEAAFRVRIAAPELPPTQRRTPADVAFVLDRSGSMGGEKIELAKQAVDEACRHLRDEDRAALVVFDNEVDLLQPLEPATSRVKTSIRMALVGVDARGGTNLSDGWFKGCSELDPNHGVNQAFAGPRIRRAILLTDGQANDGICDPRELGRHANALRQLGVGTTTLGLGHGFDEFLLSAMAEAGGGNFQYLRGAEDLREFFEKELQELLSVVAMGMKVTITCPEGVHASPVSAFPAERSGKTWTLEVGEVPAGEVLDIVFETRVQEGFAGTEARFGVEVSWSDPAGDVRRQEHVDLAPLVVGDAETVAAAPRDEESAEAITLQQVARDKKKALEADRAGDRETALGLAGGVRFRIAAAPWSPVVAAEMDDFSELYQALEDGTVTEDMRKEQVWRAEQQRKNRKDFEARRARDQQARGPQGGGSAF